jgi:hypothetical protein
LVDDDLATATLACQPIGCTIEERGFAQILGRGADESVMILVFSSGDDDSESLTTPFEEWCASMDLHPEDSRAWPLYEQSIGAETSHIPTAS